MASASDAMPGFFELLAAEQDPAVRVMLGHFNFVYIHPYMDGNGRMDRFPGIAVTNTANRLTSLPRAI